MNLALYGFGDERRRQWIIVDLGVAFAGDDLPGIDLILPDIRYLVEERKNILGIVLTHAHEDHFGAMLDLWPRLKLPVYATPFTAALLAGQARERAGRAAHPGQHRPARRPFHARSVRHRTRLHGALDSGIERVSSSGRRSAPCCTPATGRSTRPRSSARRPTRRSCVRSAMPAASRSIGDSTNAVREGRSPSETDVARTLAELIRTAPARVAVTTFASNVARMRAVGAGRGSLRPRGRAGRPLDGTHRAGRARDRLPRRHQGFPLGRHLRPPAARQGGRALHRQPGRAARRALAHRRRRSSRRRASAAATA